MKTIALTLALLAIGAPCASAQEAPDAYVSASFARVHFESADDGVVLSVSDGHGDWVGLGVGPLDLSLPLGPADLALSARNHPPVRIPIAIELTDGTRLLAHYESRQTLRELGVGVLIGTIISTLIGIAIGAGGFLANTVDVGIAGLVAGLGVGVVGGTTGLALATLDDLAIIDVL